jgi:hypothetical protein
MILCLDTPGIMEAGQISKLHLNTLGLSVVLAHRKFLE